MKLSRTCHISFCQIAPLKIRGGSASTHGAECSPRGVHRNNPLYPPYFKGEIERRALILRGILKKERPLAC